MNKKSIIAVVLGFLCLNGVSQEIVDSSYYYYYKGEKQYLTLDRTKVNITVSSRFQKEEQEENREYRVVNVRSDLTTPNLQFGRVKLDAKSSRTEYEAVVRALKDDKEIVAPLSEP